MSETAALRLLTETVRTTAEGVNASANQRQVLLDAEGVFRLRKKIGNDGYTVLETLFLLATPSPSGIVIYGGAARVAEILSWSRQKASRVIGELAEGGYIDRTQEKLTQGNGRPGFGKAVIKLDTSAIVTQDQVAKEQVQDGKGLWGDPLDLVTCQQMLTAWGVADASRLLKSVNPVLISDAVKFVAFELRSGAGINNPGAYLRTVIRRREVAAPGPHVPQDYLEGQITAGDLLASDPTQRGTTVERARAAAKARRAYLDNLLSSMRPEERSEIDLELNDLMRGFAFETDSAQLVKYYDLLEEHLAERGMLAEIPSEGTSADEEPPF